jgi:hypothetical protein
MCQVLMLLEWEYFSVVLTLMLYVSQYFPLKHLLRLEDGF